MRIVYYLPITLLLIIIMAIVPGCKKKGIDITDVTFVNRLDEEVTLDLYVSGEDYATNANMQDRIVVAANDKVVVPGENFKSGATYYIDWYTQDYYHNNWFNDDYPIDGNRVRISPKPGNNTYYFEPAYKGDGRKAFLKGTGSQTSWIAVGAYLYSSSIGYSNQWDVITVNERYRQITVKKDFTAEYIHKDAAGNLQTSNLLFLVQQSEVPYIEFQNTDGSIGGNMTGGKLPVSTASDYSSNAIDTVMALFPDNEYIFMMVRQ